MTGEQFLKKLYELQSKNIKFEEAFAILAFEDNKVAYEVPKK